jgi:hypothetical protein
LRMPTICVSLNRDFFTMDSFEAKASGFSTYFRSLFQATRHDLLGINESAARGNVRRAISNGLIVLLHPGQSRKKDRRGLSAMYGLVGLGESVADVWTKAARDEILIKRYKENPVLQIADPRQLLESPTLAFWERVKCMDTFGSPEDALKQVAHIVNELRSHRSPSVNEGGLR